MRGGKGGVSRDDESGGCIQSQTPQNDLIAVIRTVLPSRVVPTVRPAPDTIVPSRTEAGPFEVSYNRQTWIWSSSVDGRNLHQRGGGGGLIGEKPLVTV